MKLFSSRVARWSWHSFVAESTTPAIEFIREMIQRSSSGSCRRWAEMNASSQIPSFDCGSNRSRIMYGIGNRYTFQRMFTARLTVATPSQLNFRSSHGAEEEST